MNGGCSKYQSLTLSMIQSLKILIPQTMALRTLITRSSPMRAVGGLQTAVREPVISREITQIHHQKHHQDYVTNYNKALENLDASLAKGDVPADVKLQSALKFNGGDTRSIEEEAERKLGWVLKLIFAGTATLVGYQVYPYMGDNLMQQSVSLLQVKDPLFKRMGASRLSRFARDDERRLKIIEVGGAEHLLNMLGDAKEDRTRKEALKALVAISPSDEAVGYLYRAGAISVIRSIPDSSLADAEVEKYKLSLMKRFEDLKHDS